MSDCPELIPTMPLDEMLAHDFLPEHQDILDGIAGNMGRLLTRMTFMYSPEPRTMAKIVERVSTFQGDRKYYSLSTGPSTRDHLKDWIVDPGMATISQGRRLEYTPTPAGQDTLSTLGVLVVWQLKHDDMPLSTLLSGQAASKPAATPYANLPSAQARLLQVVYGRPLKLKEAEALIPSRSRSSIFNSLTVLTKAEILDQKKVGHAAVYTMAPATKPYVADLLLSLYSLRDPDFRALARQSVQEILEDEQLVQQLVRPRVAAPSLAAASEVPRWLADRVRASLMKQEDKVAVLKNVSRLIEDGVLLDHPVADRLLFSPQMKGFFTATECRAIAHYYRLQRQIYGNVVLQRHIEAALTVRGMPFERHMTAYLLPRLRAFIKDAAEEKLL